MTVLNIDPVNSVLKHCKNSKCSLRDINNMCYGICNDFDNNIECKQKCKDFIYQQNYIYWSNYKNIYIHFLKKNGGSMCFL